MSPVRAAVQPLTGDPAQVHQDAAAHWARRSGPSSSGTLEAGYYYVRLAVHGGKDQTDETIRPPRPDFVMASNSQDCTIYTRV